MVQANLFPGEDDVENWFFGESTVSAILTFQVMISLLQPRHAFFSAWRIVSVTAILGKLLQSFTNLGLHSACQYGRPFMESRRLAWLMMPLGRSCLGQTISPSSLRPRSDIPETYIIDFGCLLTWQGNFEMLRFDTRLPNDSKCTACRIQ